MDIAAFPDDILSDVCLFLDEPTLGSLRLTSGRFHRLASRPFHRNLQTLRLHLMRSDLAHLSAVAAFPALAAAIRRLDLVVPHYNITSRLSAAPHGNETGLGRDNDDNDPTSGGGGGGGGDHPRHGAARLAHREREPATRRLPGLSWKTLWNQARHTWCVVCRSIAHARVRPRALSWFQDTLGCSLTTNGICDHLHNLGPGELASLHDVLRGLRAFSVSFAPPVDLWNIRNELGGEMADPDHPKGVEMMRHVLGLMPDLRRLHLHVYNASFRGDHTPPEYCTLATVMRAADLLALEELTLRGFCVSEKYMVDLLRAHTSLRYLCLERLRLTAGSWDNVLFAACQAGNIKRVRLSGLWTLQGVTKTPQSCTTSSPEAYISRRKMRIGRTISCTTLPTPGTRGQRAT
ncbi:unnamed protein product [Parascedosporium putredinis]|uniref:F-box domain-containing protein n=1 Tax=Parascedosporium putredinis TaxID=1442378 RepID=A0A9P1H124_9PEZI|nr:unnamed protein product [Parascedosporium putredinis]CAI7992338.1 unnamed protein product [Parascedosporium putredinis]